MGRKIPGAKHRGVKDPLKQKLQREAKLKKVVNAPPSDPNVQEIPRSVKEMNRLRELIKEGSFSKKKKKNKKQLDSSWFYDSGPKLPKMDQNDLHFPRLKQRPGETEESFLLRLDSATNDALSEARMEAKHDIVISRNESGLVTDVKPKEKDSLDLVQSSQQKGKHNTKIVTSETTKAKSKTAYLKERKLKRKLQKIRGKEEIDSDKKIDHVAFGEVAHQPPQLKRRPRGCDKSHAERPGKKDLLLKNLFEPSSNQNKSMSDLKHLASARQEAIAVYKQMKAKNRINQPKR